MPFHGLLYFGEAPVVPTVRAIRRLIRNGSGSFIANTPNALVSVPLGVGPDSGWNALTGSRGLAQPSVRRPLFLPPERPRDPRGDAVLPVLENVDVRDLVAPHEQRGS